MAYVDGLLVLVELVLLVYCVLSIITTPPAAVRNLPKVVWLVLVILLPLVGGIAWLVAGRPVAGRADLPRRGRRAAPVAPDDDEAFLRGLRERADLQRRDAERQRLALEEQQREDDRQRRDEDGEPGA